MLDASRAAGAHERHAEWCLDGNVEPARLLGARVDVVALPAGRGERLAGYKSRRDLVGGAGVHRAAVLRRRQLRECEVDGRGAGERGGPQQSLVVGPGVIGDIGRRSRQALLELLDTLGERLLLRGVRLTVEFLELFVHCQVLLEDARLLR